MIGEEKLYRLTQQWFSDVDFRRELAQEYRGKSFQRKMKFGVHFTCKAEHDEKIWDPMKHVQSWIVQKIEKKPVGEDDVDPLCTMYTMYHIVEKTLSLPPLLQISDSYSCVTTSTQAIEAAFLKKYSSDELRVTHNSYLLLLMARKLAEEKQFFRIAKRVWPNWSVNSLRENYKLSLKEFYEDFVLRFLDENEMKSLLNSVRKRKKRRCLFLEEREERRAKVASSVF